jgi:peptidyl-dipeptidase A
MKSELDATLKRKYGIAGSESYPWLYSDPFFQEFPSAGQSESLDDVFHGYGHRGSHSCALSQHRPRDRRLASPADLYERDGKSQHAFCMDVDHEGDVRVLCNIRKNERWMSTMLHEFGHAVYDKYNDRSLPFLLRSPAHT